MVWLNEAQRYLGSADGIGERVAAGLRELLRDTARGPIVVLATMWPQYWHQLTIRPPARDDPHAQARELLAGHDIPVPAAFTLVELERLDKADDPRLAQAAAGSRDGQVIQYLAGAPELLAVYRNAPAAAKALIHAAMDARRLGMRPALSLTFLEAAAPGYLSDCDWELLPDDWLEQALTITAAPCKGVRGPLTPVRPRLAPDAATCDSGPAWQLAEYLDQAGRDDRRSQIPPPSFWTAAAATAHPGDLAALGFAAQLRGLYRDAAQLLKLAIAGGDSGPAADLIDNLGSSHPGDQGPAEWLAGHLTVTDPGHVAWLLRPMQRVGALEQLGMVFDRAAAHASLRGSTSYS